MRHAFNMAMRKWEWLNDNPLKRVSMEKEPPGRVRYLTDEEFDRPYETCSDWLKPIVLVARHTGGRRENILSLTWNQVNLSRRIIIMEHTKNRERLGIPLNDTLMDLFKRISRVRHIRSPYVFCRPVGMRYMEIKRAFQKLLRVAGIKDFKFHDLRHCFASALVQRGVDLYQVQRLPGHKDGRMTQRYAHLSSENLRDAVLKLDVKQEQRKNLSQLYHSWDLWDRLFGKELCNLLDLERNLERATGIEPATLGLGSRCSTG